MTELHIVALSGGKDSNGEQPIMFMIPREYRNQMVSRPDRILA
jgi:hypothetical protein